MILPQSYTASLLLMILGLLCYGSWASTFLLARGRWRFELYCFDFAFGLLAMALLCGFTFGSSGFDGFSLLDDFIRAGKRQWVLGFVSGVLFNLANMLLLGAISVAGMAVAFPVAMGIALIVVGIWLAWNAPNDPFMLAAGCLLVLAATGAGAFSGSRIASQRRKAKRGSAPAWIKPLALCAASGLIFGIYYRANDWARSGEAGLGPYAAVVMLAAGAMFSTFVFNLFFMNLPVEGEPLEVLDYFHGGFKVHGYGLLGGAVWCIAEVAAFAAAAAPPEAQIGNAATLALTYGGPVIAALWGLVVWREFERAAVPAKRWAWLAIALFASGLTIFSLAFSAAPQP